MNQKEIQDVFTYAYPIYGMYQLLHKQIMEDGGDWNTFHHIATVSTPKTAFVPAPNNDTAYSRAWLDLRNGPIVIETPDTKGRYFTLHMMDMASETIGNYGKRVHGTKPHRFVFMDKNWQGTLDDDMIAVCCDTSILLAFMRILLDSAEDIPQVEQLQKQFHIYPLFKEKQEQNNASFPALATTFDVTWFQTTLAFLQLFSDASYDALQKQRIQSIIDENPEKLIELCNEQLHTIDINGKQFGEQDHYWRIARHHIGVYQDDYMQRAVVWFKGALANVPEESLYPSVFQDEQGNILDGRFSYRLKFDASNLPQVSQFWSLTMYKFVDGFLAENAIDRYSIGDRTSNLTYGKDGSLSIYLSAQKPSDPFDNWLPAPREPFYLTLRLYGPSQATIKGEWHPPLIKKISDSHDKE